MALLASAPPGDRPATHPGVFAWGGPPTSRESEGLRRYIAATSYPSRENVIGSSSRFASPHNGSVTVHLQLDGEPWEDAA